MKVVMKYMQQICLTIKEVKEKDFPPEVASSVSAALKVVLVYQCEEVVSWDMQTSFQLTVKAEFVCPNLQNA